MQDMDFARIVARLSGKHETFEELCSQLAEREWADDKTFTRLNGAGGDGGVECYYDAIEGCRVGLQAKYVTALDALMKQAGESLATALSIHPTLKRYVVCFPFDLTGPTGRKAKSQVEKINDWIEEQSGSAKSQGRQLTIELWPASKLRSLLLKHDARGGMREYFFNEAVLSHAWFSEHLELAKAKAGPRYSSELTVETPLSSWFDSFGKTDRWRDSFDKLLSSGESALRGTFRYAGSSASSTSSDGDWPTVLQSRGRELCEEAESGFASLRSHLSSTASISLHDCTEQLADLVQKFRSFETDLVLEFESKHGKGRADSPGFRQFMAEFHVSLPAAGLDTARVLISRLEETLEWLQSPLATLSSQLAFALTGNTGVGKTHGVCDVAHQRHREGSLNCVLYGHEFNGEPEFWNRFGQIVGITSDLGRDGILNALNSAAQAAGAPLFIFLDGVNETKPRTYWRGVLGAVKLSVERYKHLRLCISCRTGFQQQCLPPETFLEVEHTGFRGRERQACREFFEHYGLRPLTTPLLLPECSNGLYLKIACETARAKGLDALPVGWRGLRDLFKAYLDWFETRFAEEHGTAGGARTVSKALVSITKAVLESSSSSLEWGQAIAAVSEKVPSVNSQVLLHWLVDHQLLIEDPPIDCSQLEAEETLRIAYDRLSDTLAAQYLLEGLNQDTLSAALNGNTAVAKLLADPVSVLENLGVVGAISQLLAEELAPQSELPDYIDSAEVRLAVLKVTLSTLPWRSAQSFSASTESCLRNALGNSDLAHDALAAVVSVAWQPSILDAFWLDRLLRSQPLSYRDAFWSRFLYAKYEEAASVKQLIHSAFESPLHEIDIEDAKRWLMLLFWFAAAADRRVKDYSTRAATRVLTAFPQLATEMLDNFFGCDDDAVRERVFLTTYGALLVSRNAKVSADVSDWLIRNVSEEPSRFGHALLRDHARFICELNEHLNENCETNGVAIFSGPLTSDWPLEIPTAEQVEEWRSLPRLVDSCTHDDFYVYVLSCLDCWSEGVPRDQMGRWMVSRIAREFDYESSGAEYYDRFIMQEYGPGRGREPWAERLGKKYQWIALHQLAARLSDHVPRKESMWGDGREDTDPILIEERELDPTFCTSSADAHASAIQRWLPGGFDFTTEGSISDASWVTAAYGMAELSRLLKAFCFEDLTFQAIDSYLNWSEKKREEVEPLAKRRQVYAIVQAYLVSDRSAKQAYDQLVGRNLFGRWLPDRQRWWQCFIGEYPWASCCQPVSESASEDEDKRVSVYRPAVSELGSSRELDATLSESRNLYVPCHLLAGSAMSWDGKNGFRDSEGTLAFFDPTSGSNGQRVLFANGDVLGRRLRDLRCQLIWTMVGEKFAGNNGPRATFSQVARLHKAGQLQVSVLRFFENYDESVGFGANGS
jgi:hypothetical protein